MKLLKINEVCTEYLSVGRTTVYELVNKGELRLVHVQGCSRITLNSVVDYMSRLERGVK